MPDMSSSSKAPKDSPERDSLYANLILAALDRALVGPTSLSATQKDLTDLMGGGSILDPTSLRKPETYYERVNAVRNGYQIDPLFRRLVNRAVEFGSTKTNIQALSKEDRALSVKDLLAKAQSQEGLSPSTRKEQEFWDEWAESLNDSRDDALPGLTPFKTTNLKNMLLDGMSVIVLRMERRKFSNGNTYIVPSGYTTLPALLTVLQRESDTDLLPKERVYINRSGQVELLSIPTINNQNAQSFHPVKGLSEFDPRSLRPRSRETSRQFSHTLKYLHSPSDPSVAGIHSPSTSRKAKAGVISQEHGIYPDPPFASLQTAFKIRQQASASDLAILDGLIKQILYFSVGNKDVPLIPDKTDSGGNVTEPGTMSRLSNLLTVSKSGHMIQLLIPWWIELKKLETDPATLMSFDKFLHATTSIYAAFGIFIAPPQTREEFSEANRTSFEEMLDSMVRGHHTAFLRKLTRMMVQWNDNLSAAPLIYDLPTNTRQESFLDFLLSVRDRGGISSQTLLEHAGLDPAYELARVISEVGSGRRDVEGENVPVSFVQQTMGGSEDGEEGSGGKDTPGRDSQGDGNKTRQSNPSGRRRTGNETQNRPRK